MAEDEKKTVIEALGFREMLDGIRQCSLSELLTSIACAVLAYVAVIVWSCY